MRGLKYIGCLEFLLLCLLTHAETVTYNVQSYNTLSVTGVAPNGSSATFFSDTQSGNRISAGHTATLTLTGFDGLMVRSIRLAMRSNKSAGAGSLTLYMGETLMAAIADASFADDSWNGAYVNDSMVTIPVPLSASFIVQDDAPIVLTVSASVNSLYLGACTVEYESESLLCHTVFLSTGTSTTLLPMQESMPGHGVVLPMLPDADSVWHFKGWVEAQVPHTSLCPMYYPAGVVYHMQTNRILYALYTNKVTLPPLVQDTAPTSGLYAIVNAQTYNCMMTGAVVQYRVETVPAEPMFGADSLYRLPIETVPQECRYQLDIVDGDRADRKSVTIQHAATGKYIGYSTSSTHQLRSNAGVWSMWRMANGSWVFYHDLREDGSAYCLHPSFLEGEKFYSEIRLAPAAHQEFSLLFRVPDIEPQPAQYTTYPLSGAGVQDVVQKQVNITPRLVENPSELTLQLYTLSGILLLTTQTHLSLEHLPAGLYILRTPHAVHKLRVGAWK